MLRRILSSTVAVLVATAGCASLPADAPTTMAQVRDGSSVRFKSDPAGNVVHGLALGWDRVRPSLVLATGDTIAVPSDARLEVKLPQKKAHPFAGAAIGWAIGVPLTYASCENKRYCGEQNPIPLLATAAGWLVGRAVKTDWWVVVR